MPAPRRRCTRPASRPTRTADGSGRGTRQPAPAHGGPLWRAETPRHGNTAPSRRVEPSGGSAPRPSVRPRPRPRRRGLDAGPRPARLPDAGRRGRAARVPALLGGRAPQHARDRQLGARRPAGARRRRHLQHPARVGRGDAAQPCLPRRGRAVRHARGPPPRPHRSRHRPRPRHRRADRPRPAPVPPGPRRRRLPGPARRADGLLRRRLPRGPPVPVDHRRARPRLPAGRCGCWDRATTRPGPRGSSACRSRSPTTSRRPTPCRPWPCTARRSGRPATSPPPT